MDGMGKGEGGGIKEIKDGIVNISHINHFLSLSFYTFHPQGAGRSSSLCAGGMEKYFPSFPSSPIQLIKIRKKSQITDTVLAFGLVCIRFKGEGGTLTLVIFQFMPPFSDAKIRKNVQNNKNN
jgi:hypothetical protein